MKILVNKTHIITFTVEAFWSEEGGMGHAAFSEITHNELGPAIDELAQASVQKPEEDWILVTHVYTVTNTHEQKEKP